VKHSTDIQVPVQASTGRPERRVEAPQVLEQTVNGAAATVCHMITLTNAVNQMIRDRLWWKGQDRIAVVHT